MLAEWELVQFHPQHHMYVEYNPAVPLTSSDGNVEDEKDKDKYINMFALTINDDDSNSSSSSSSSSNNNNNNNNNNNGVKTRVIPVIIGATGTISKSFRNYRKQPYWALHTNFGKC